MIKEVIAFLKSWIVRWFNDFVRELLDGDKSSLSAERDRRVSDTYSRCFGGFLVFALGLFLGVFLLVFVQIADQGNGGRPMIQSWGDLIMLIGFAAVVIGLLVSGFLLMRGKPGRKSKVPHKVEKWPP